MIRKDWRKPIQAMSDAVRQPCRANEVITGELVTQQIDRVIDQRAPRKPLGQNADERGFVVMGVNDVDVLSANDPAEQSQELKIEREFLMRWTNLRVRLRVKGSGAMHFCPAHLDITLTKRVSYDMNVVAHIRQRIGHFPNTRGRAVIGRKRTGRHYGDRVTAFPAALRGSQVTHETPEVEAGAGLAGLESFAAPGPIGAMEYLR